MRFKSVAVDYYEIQIVKKEDDKGRPDSAPHESFLRVDSFKKTSKASSSTHSDAFDEFATQHSYHAKLANIEIAEGHARKADRKRLEKEYRNR